jgi:hypothetical protein
MHCVLTMAIAATQGRLKPAPLELLSPLVAAQKKNARILA